MNLFRAVLAAVQDFFFFVCVRVDARDAAAFPLRPVDVVTGGNYCLPLSIVNVIITSFVILAKMTWWGAK